MTAIALLLLVSGCVTRVTRASHISWRSSWSTYMGGPTRSGFASGNGIDGAQARSLAVRWSRDAGGAVSSEPIVAGHTLFWGGWNGYAHATSEHGRTIWSVNVGQTRTTGRCPTSVVGMAGSAAFSMERVNGVRTPVVFVPGGEGAVYALRADTGALIWRRAVAPGSRTATLWGSSLVYRGRVYVGVSSLDDCPLVPGAVEELDASTGLPLHQFRTVPAGCIGNGIWGSPTLDPIRHTIYVVTGNPGRRCRQGEPFGEAIVELRARDLSVIGSWAVPQSQRGRDSDFGSTPTLFTADIRGQTRRLVGVVNKNGIYYAFETDRLRAGPLWESRISIGGVDPTLGQGDISPSAWDGSRLYVGGGRTREGGRACPGGVRALNPSTGRTVWRQCLAAPVLAGITGASGMVLVAAGDELRGLDPRTGTVLFSRVVPGAKFWGTPSIGDGRIYEGSMTGRLYAVSPRSRSG